MQTPVSLLPWQRGAFLQAEQRHLLIDGLRAEDLIAQYGSPLYVYSQDRLQHNAQAMLNAFRGVHNNTRICFASKACANIAVLKVLKAAGLSIEVNSGGEFYKAKEAGFSPQQMVFNGVAKLKEELEQVIAEEIKAINVDSLAELQRILAVAQSNSKPANIALRIIPEIKGGAEAGWETGTSESKFGMTAEEQQQAIALVKQHREYLQLVGIHAHIGTQVNDEQAYMKEAQFLINYVKKISAELPRPLQHINLGGGFPKHYSAEANWPEELAYYKQNYRAQIDVQRIADILIKPVSLAFGSELEILLEPGRSMVSDAAVLLTTVEAEKHRNGHKLFYLDAGYSVLFDAFIGWYFHMLNASKADEQAMQHCRVVGPLCDSSDTFYDIEGEGKVASLLKHLPELAGRQKLLEQLLVHQPGYKELPASTAIGDVIALCDVGAYAFEMMNDYCGRLMPAAVMVTSSGRAQLIRRRAVADDLLRYDVYS